MKSEKDVEEDLFFGIGPFKPAFLQRFASANWFLLFLSLFSIFQGMLVNGVISGSIPHLEREFGLTSTQSGFISSSNDISGILFVLVVSYYGGKGHKPRWLGYGAIVTGIGALLFVTPKFMKGIYTAGTIPDHFKDYKTCHSNLTISDSNGCEEATGSSSTLYLFIFYGATMIMGLGTTPLFTLGAAYLDENVTPKNSPIYIGIWFISTFLGPSVGFLVSGVMLNMYVDPGKTPAGFNPNEPLWVGRWWLPFIVFCWPLIFVGLVILMFPPSIPGAAAIRAQAIENGEVEKVSRDSEKEVGFKGFVKATLEMISNKTLILICLALCSKVLVASGVGPFLIKITIIKYGAKPSEANFIVGLLIVSGSAVGLVLGSIVMRQLKITSSIKVATVICALLAILGVLSSFTFYISGCETLNLYGINMDHSHSNKSSFNLIGQCNSHCSCLKEYYNPVCNEGVTYFSPCFAGCSNESTINIYTNCSCLKPEQNTTFNQFVTKGKCDQNCKNMVLFLVAMFFTLILSFSSGTPNNMMVLRSVPEDRKSFAMGFQFLFLRSLAMLPGPILIGKTIDSTCLVWKYNECGKRTNCAEYDVDYMTKLLTIISICGSAASFIFYVAAWKVHKPTQNVSYQQDIDMNVYDNKGLSEDNTTF